MIEHIRLKQADREVEKTETVLKKELSLAIKQSRKGDEHYIRQVLQSMSIEVDADEGLPQRVVDKVEEDKYWRLHNQLQTLHPLAVRSKLASKGAATKVAIAADANPLKQQLLQLLKTLKHANIGLDGKEAHHDLESSDNDLHVGKQIHLAQTNILIFVCETLPSSDSGEALFNALSETGFLAYLLDYLKQQGCNKQASSQLKKLLERISCNTKS